MVDKSFLQKEFIRLGALYSSHKVPLFIFGKTKFVSKWVTALSTHYTSINTIDCSLNINQTDEVVNKSDCLIITNIAFLIGKNMHHKQQQLVVFIEKQKQNNKMVIITGPHSFFTQYQSGELTAQLYTILSYNPLEAIS